MEGKVTGRNQKTALIGKAQVNKVSHPALLLSSLRIFALKHQRRECLALLNGPNHRETFFESKLKRTGKKALGFRNWSST